MWRVNGDGLIAALNTENLEYLAAGGTTVWRDQILRGHTDVNSNLDYSLRESYSRFMRTSILNIEDVLLDRFSARGIKDLVGYFLVQYLRSHPPFFACNGYSSFMLSCTVDSHSYCRDILREHSRMRGHRDRVYQDIVSSAEILAFWGRIEAHTPEKTVSWEIQGDGIVYDEKQN